MESRLPNKAKSSNFTYTLFLYQKELSRRNAHGLKLTSTKVQITESLISKNLRVIERLNAQELRNLNREILYRKKLKQHIKSLREDRTQRNKSRAKPKTSSGGN